MKTFTWTTSGLTTGLQVQADEKLGNVIFLGETGRGRRYEKVGLARHNPAEILNGRVFEAQPIKITLPAKDGKPAAYIDGEPENYEQKNLSNSMEEGVKEPTASQDRLPKDQINNQDSGEINNLRLEIASHKLSSIITIEEPSVNSGLAGKFNPKEVFSSGQEKFVGYLEKTNLRTLIGYIEMGGIKIKKVKELSLADKKSLTLLKKREKGMLLVNPRLYFLSKADAGLLATKELLKRLKVDKESKQSI